MLSVTHEKGDGYENKRTREPAHWHGGRFKSVVLDPGFGEPQKEMLSGGCQEKCVEK